MRTYIYKIRLLFILKTFSISFVILIVVGLIIILDIAGIKKINTDVLLLIVLIQIGPSLFLLIEYLIISSKIKIKISGKEIEVHKNNTVLIYQYSDILNVTKYCSFPVSQNRKRYYFATDTYYFLKITMNDNEEYIVTSLMTDTKHNQFTVKETKARFIPTLIWN